MRHIFRYLFGCTHEHATFPRARKDRAGRVLYPVRNYVACLDCGAELDYTLFDSSRKQAGIRQPASAQAVEQRSAG